MSDVFAGDFVNRLRKKYFNKEFVLIGNGPSLKIEDLDYLYNKNIHCYGVNKIFLSYESTDWRPDIYSFTDHAIIPSVMDNLLRYKHNEILLPASMKPKTKNFSNKLSISFVNHLSRSSAGFTRTFSTDASNVTYGGFTVLFFALQILYSIGVRRVYLLGVDHNYSNASTVPLTTRSHNGRLIKHISGSNHFHKNYFSTGEVVGDVYLNEAEESFRMAKQIFERSGGQIINCTANSRLKLFQKSELRNEL